MKLSLGFMDRAEFLQLVKNTFDRPLDDLKEFSATMTTEINDLPPTARTELTSTTMHRFLDLHPRPKCGTAKAHRDNYARTPFQIECEA